MLTTFGIMYSELWHNFWWTNIEYSGDILSL